MSKGWKYNGHNIPIDISKYGVRIDPEPIYEYPEGHPCRGCPFTFKVSKPSCMFGSYPNTRDCPNAFHKKILEKQRAERQAKLKSQEVSDEN